jgi:hypothetical protein
MTSPAARLDCIYVAASRSDARFTRICIASIRRLYPSIPIRLLAGGPLQPGLAAELARHWDVAMADVPRRDWGWGFVKLEPLFGPDGEHFLVLDSDTAFTGPVLEIWAESDADFLVDDEQQSEAELARLYYDWRKVGEIDQNACPPRFVFNSGQWFGTAGVLRRRDFAPFIDWDEPRPRLRRPHLFMPGDQGVLNYVVNQKAQLEGLSVERQRIMRWPGHGMTGLSAKDVAAGRAPRAIVHWAGMKKARLGAMVGGDLLRYFERGYYGRVPGGEALRIARGCFHAMEPLRGRVERRLHALVSGGATATPR